MKCVKGQVFLPPKNIFPDIQTYGRFKVYSLQKCTQFCRANLGPDLRLVTPYPPVDGQNPAPPGMVKTCENLINNGIIIILGGAGFCPSTVAREKWIVGIRLHVSFWAPGLCSGAFTLSFSECE